MRHITLRSLTLSSMSIAALALMGCAGTAEDEDGSYDLVVEDRFGTDYAIAGSKPSCKVNTSFPDSDPKRGKYFVGLTASGNPDVVVSLYVHFLEYTDAPPAGTYANSDPMVDISFSTTFSDDSVAVADNERDLSNTSVTVTDGGDGIRMTLDGGFPGASGYVQCAP